MGHAIRDRPAVDGDVGRPDDFETELRKWLVGIEIDAKFEVWSLELRG